MIDPFKLRPRQGWCIILADQRRETLASGLILPVETQAEKLGQGVGTLVMVGSGTLNKTLGLEPGQRVFFRDYIKHAIKLDTELTWEDGSKKHFFLVDSNDIVGVLGPGVDVHVYSGRPMVPAA